MLERHSFVYKGHDKQGLEVSDTKLKSLKVLITVFVTINNLFLI